MELDSDSKKGVVNHGFSVEFSSEEDISDVDVSHSSFTPKERTCHFDSAITNALPTPDTFNNPVNIKSKNSLTHESIPDSYTRLRESAGNNNVAGNRDQSSSDPTNLPIPLTTESKQRSHETISDNVQTGSMVPARIPAESASFIPNGKGQASEIKNSKAGGLNDEYNNTEPRRSKEYFRDVRLSLDTSKPITSIAGGSLPFHNSINSSGRKSHSIQSYTDDSDLSCDGCASKLLKQYKIVFEYVVQRPLFCFSVWTMFYIFWGDDALPGGSLFALTILELTAIFLAYVAEILQLPGLLGMAAAGLILRNVPYIDVAKDLDLSVSSPLRSVSIVILLVRGALGVNPVNIVKFKNIIPPLVIGSCVLEAVAASIAIYFILDFPIEWAALMGCIISAMSGVAVLPYLASTEKLLALKANPCSLSPNHESVITIARTACGMDAMIAICLAEVALGFIVADGNAGQGVLKGAGEVLLGGAFGVVWGLLAGFLLDETSSNEKRSMTIFSCGVMSFMGLPKIGYPRAAPLAVFAGVLITGTIWKKRQIGGSGNEQLSATYTLIWYIFQPLLFAIIGARTDFDRVDWTIVWKGLICIAISLLVRLITTFITTTVAGQLSVKERIYMCIAWIPKGTVQAALGPLALDTVSSLKNLSSPDTYEDLGYKVMNISTVSFIVTALLGCLCLRFIGPRLLSQR